MVTRCRQSLFWVIENCDVSGMSKARKRSNKHVTVSVSFLSYNTKLGRLEAELTYCGVAELCLARWNGEVVIVVCIPVYVAVVSLGMMPIDKVRLRLTRVSS